MSHSDRIATLEEQKQILIRTILMISIPNEDYHGVMDAAADIREIDVKIELLKELGDIDETG